MASDEPAGPADHDVAPTELVTPQVVVVHPVGDIDSATVGLLRTAIATRIAEGATHVVLDLAAVEFMGSAGLALLIAERETAQARGGSVRLAAVPRMADRALRLTGLDELFATYPDAGTAVADLR